MAKDEKTESNPLEFLLVIFVALGIVGYKFVQEKGINTIIQMAINGISLIIGFTLLVLLTVFSIRDFMDQKRSIFSNKHIRIFTIIITGILISVSYFNIDYLYIEKFLTIKNILILIIPIIIILILYYKIINYLESKKLFQEHIEEYLSRKYDNTNEVALAIAEIESFQNNNTRIERIFHKRFDEILLQLKTIQYELIQESYKTELTKEIAHKAQIQETQVEQKLVDKLVEYFKERKTSEAIPEWALTMGKETIRQAIEEYKEYREAEYYKERVWEKAVEFMLEYKGLPNDYQSLSQLKKELYMKAYRLMKEHKLEKTSKENPQVLEEDEELVEKYFYTASELTAEQRHRFIHNYGYRLKPFIFVEDGKRGNNLIIKNDTRKESDYHFCIKHLLANIHKKNAYIEYDIEQLRTDIMINVNGQLYAFEIETGNNKALQIERKTLWLNKHFNQWYIVCSRDNKKIYKKYVSKKKGQILTVTQAYKKILEINHLTGQGTLR